MIDIDLILSSLPLLLRGARVSLQIAALSALIGIGFGTLLGLLQSGKNKLLQYAVGLYVLLVRGTPMLIHITVAVYVLPQIGIKLPIFWAALLAIGFNSAAYVSQIVRSGIASVSKGQIEAAKTLGLSSFQITRYIILPQALQAVLPALGNEFITLIKDSSLASIVGVTELARQGSLIRSRTFDALSIYLAVAILYLIMTTSLSLLLYLLEKRLNRHVSS